MIFARKDALLIGVALLILASAFMTGCGDTYRPVATPINSSGGDTDNSAVVAVLNRDSLDYGTLTYIDATGDTNSGNINAGYGVLTAAYDANRAKVYVTDSTSDTISVLSSSSTTTLTMTTGTVPTRVFPGAVGYVYSISASPNTVCPSSGSVGVIDNSSIALLYNMCVGSSPAWITYDSLHYRLYVADKVDNKLYVIDTVTPKVLSYTVAVDAAPVWDVTSLDSNYVYVISQSAKTVSVVNTTTNAVVNSYTTGTGIPIKGYLDTKLNRLYVLSQGSDTTQTGTVTAYDASGLSTLVQLHAPIATGADPVEIAGLADGSRLYVANGTSNTVTQIDTGVFSAVTIPVSDNTTDRITSVAVSDDSRKVYAPLLTTGDWNNGTMSLLTTYMTSGLSSISAYKSGFVDAPCQHPINITDMVARDGGTGTLPSGTYYYVVSVIDSTGSESTTLPSNEVTITVDGSQAPKLTWTALSEAASYNVYRGTTSGGEKLLVSGLASGTNSFLDDNSYTQSSTAAAVPTGCLRQQPVQAIGWK
jgi:DNA-binding beta-propeller fold protein YncE